MEKFTANVKLVTLQRNRKQRSPRRRDMALFPLKNKTFINCQGVGCRLGSAFCSTGDCFKMYYLKSL